MNWNESGSFETIGKEALFSTRGFDLKVGHFLKIVFLTIRTVRLQAKPHTLIIIQCHAPTSTAREEESDAFYDALQEGCEIATYNMNAKSGEREKKSKLRPTVHLDKRTE